MSMMIMIGHSSGTNFQGKKKLNLGIVNTSLKNRVLVKGLQFVIQPIK